MQITQYLMEVANKYKFQIGANIIYINKNKVLLKNLYIK